MLNLSIILSESAKRRPNHPAFVLGDSAMTFAQLDALANKVANGLVAKGVGKGDRVAFSCPNVPFFPVVYYGILKTGATVVTLNVLLKAEEIAYHLNDSGAKVYCCFEGSKELPIAQFGKAGFEQAPNCEEFIVIENPANATPLVDEASSFNELILEQPDTFETVCTEPNDTAIILYTSGTTGKPKGAELSHSNMMQNAQLVPNLFRLTPEDKCLIALPMFHSFGQTVLMNASVLNGSTGILFPRFDPRACLEILVKEKVTFFAGVPTMYWALLNAPNLEEHRDTVKKHLRLAVSGGGALPLQVLEDFDATFKAPILEGYGLSETSPIACFNQLEFPSKAGSIGKPVWGVDMKIFDENDHEVPVGEEGEVVIRGHNVMKSYWQRPEESAEALKNDWFHTGDMGKVDEEGYFYIVDRKKDMIIRDGLNVYPREVEECIIKHEAVSLVAVIGIPDAKHGEEIKAVVVLKEEAELKERELMRWTQQRLANYKCPRKVEFVDSLPMNATGKILKRELREQLAEQL